MTISFSGTCNQVFREATKDKFKDQVNEGMVNSSICNGEAYFQLCDRDSYSIDCASSRSRRRRRETEPDDILLVVSFWTLKYGTFVLIVEPLFTMLLLKV